MRNFGKTKKSDPARHRTMSIFQDKAKDNTDDAQLIMELRSPQTCRAAFGRVIAMYTEPLYRQIRRMVQSHDDANDLLQNTFIKAWSSLEFSRRRPAVHLALQDSHQREPYVPRTRTSPPQHLAGRSAGNAGQHHRRRPVL